jgi:hypothetical protein
LENNFNWSILKWKFKLFYFYWQSNFEIYSIDFIQLENNIILRLKVLLHL